MIDRPAPLSRQPDGLLGFLGIKNGGRNPQFLIETVQPTFDLYAHYLNTAPEYGYVDSTVVLGASIIFLANPGEILYVTDFNVEAVTVAGQAIRYDLRRGRQNVGDVALTAPTNIGASSFTSLSFNQPIWLMPDEWLGIGASLVTAGPVQTYAYARFVRLPM